MQITKSLFDEIKPGEIFWTVTTNLFKRDDPNPTNRTYVCVKGRIRNDWVINSSFGTAQPDDIARYGDQLTESAAIRAICPVDDEVFELYRK